LVIVGFAILPLDDQQGQLAGWHSRTSMYPNRLVNMLLMAEMSCMQPIQPKYIKLTEAFDHNNCGGSPS
jgi:hypothetical protein